MSSRMYSDDEVGHTVLHSGHSTHPCCFVDPPNPLSCCVYSWSVYVKLQEWLLTKSVAFRDKQVNYVRALPSVMVTS